VYRRRREIGARLQELGKREKEWVKPLRGRRGPLRGRDIDVRFGRGFPHLLFMTAGLFLERAEEIFCQAPITELCLYDVRDTEVEPLIHSPGLAKVTSLHLAAGQDEPIPLGRVGLSEHLGGLEELWFWTSVLTADEVSILADAPALAGLKRLGISGEAASPNNVIEGDALQRLTGSRRLRHLEQFHLGGARLDSDALAALAASPVFARLTSLTLGNGSLAPEGLRALASAASAPGLRNLNLESSRLGGDEGVAVLARSDSWPALRRLNLYDTDLGPDGALALADSPALDPVTYLSLGSNWVGDVGARALAASPHVANLRFLDLDRCDITAEGARALADSPFLGKLRSLRMGDNRFQTKGRTILRERFGDVVEF
jgi:hypothetical protein